MTTWDPRANELFLKALELRSPDERDAYLDGECDRDTALRAEVESLLEASARAGCFLESPVPSLAATAEECPLSEGPGTVIGPYKLLEQIGEGGFGVVFMAEQQDPIRRKVAVKVLKPGMDTRQVIARFEAERQALALMDHPNIARVLDAGATQSGRPYFVMELVRALPITEYCDQNHVPVRERLELFGSVCQAVHHAHQKGIIHRDIKPSNVMITLHDGTPVVKVIDFGIAKAMDQQLTDKTLFTNYAQMIGTPLYMSPEQAGLSGLDVDTRSDIYSLGVLLYELLTGTTPFDKDRFKEAGYDEIRRIIREEEPPRPSTRLSDTWRAERTAQSSENKTSSPSGATRFALRALRFQELDWIVMKALEKDRNRRYESARALAADIERYLHDEPVQAGPPSAGYRFRKFARRNKTGLAVAGLTLFFMVLLGMGAGWLIRDKSARHAAVARELELAMQEASTLQEQKKWPEAREAAKQAQRILAGQGNEEIRERVHQLRKDLEMVLRLEEIRLPPTVAGVEGDFDDLAAVASYAQAFREYDIDVSTLEPAQAAERIRARSIRLELALALDHWARYARGTSKPDDPKANETSVAQLIAVARAADPDPWRNQLRDAWEQRRSETLKKLVALPDVNSLPAQTWSLLVLFNSSLGREQALAVLRLAQRKFPDDYWINFKLAYTMDFAPTREQQLDEAVRFYTAAVALRPRNAPAYFFLASAQKRRGNLDEAIAGYRKVIELKPDHAKAHNSLGIAFQAKGHRDEAVAEIQEAIRLEPNNWVFHYNLGVFLAKQGRRGEAVEAYQEAIRLQPGVAKAHSNLGTLLVQQGKLAEAIEEYRAAVKLEPSEGLLHYNLAFALKQSGNEEQSLQEFRKAIESKHPEGSAYHELSLLLLTCSDPKLRNPRQARDFANKGIQFRPQSPTAWQVLGWAQYRSGAWKDSIAALKKSIELQKDGGSPRQWFLLAMAHWQLGNREEARRWLDQATRWLEKHDSRMEKDQPRNEELRRFRAEARELFGITEKKH
jgi:serine/threonine protein kinase/Flp pilus assembly protein TadD